jgi:signal transduction histidine kinase
MEIEDVHPVTGEPVTIGLTTVPLHTESDAFLGFLALFTDLTPIRSLEARVQDMTTLAQLGEISAGIAHEFRNSLHTILGYMKLARKGGIDSMAEARLQSAEKEAALLLQAIERLLAFARPVVLNAERVDLRELIAEQIGGGSITVTLRDEPVPSVTIADTGIGFNPADGPRFFLPFQSGKPNGFGMGLPLAKKIVLLHGGTLRLTGEIGNGAVATIEFGEQRQT